MCGRYVKKTDDAIIEDDLELQRLLEQGYEPRYNIAPSQKAPVVTSEEPRRLQAMRWGLVPSWVEDIRVGNKMINACAETIDAKPAFKKAFLERRCLIPGDGFYEWKQTAIGKFPMYIHAADERFITFAGLWDEWKDAEGRVLRTFTIITTAPNALMAEIHDRMPVIVEREDREKWLNPATAITTLTKLLRPCPEGILIAHRVSNLVNSPLKEGAELILPLESLPSGWGEGQQSLF